ncbi:hypothetical protein ABPG72_007694 [Tetrahymena utriculariae]
MLKITEDYNECFFLLLTFLKYQQLKVEFCQILATEYLFTLSQTDNFYFQMFQKSISLQVEKKLKLIFFETVIQFYLSQQQNQGYLFYQKKKIERQISIEKLQDFTLSSNQKVTQKELKINFGRKNLILIAKVAFLKKQIKKCDQIIKEDSCFYTITQQKTNLIDSSRIKRTFY